MDDEEIEITSERNDEAAATAVADLAGAVGGGRVAWAYSDDVDVVAIFRRDIPMEGEGFVVDIEGVEYIVSVRPRG